MHDDRATTITGLRAWARGSYAEEAAVELLARGFGGRFASTGWPWVKACDRAGWYWLDGDAIWMGAGVLSGGERRFLSAVGALVGGQPPADLGGVLAGLDRQNLKLILAAFAHAAGSHDEYVMTVEDGEPRLDRVGPVIDWPPAVEPLAS
jgi:hypothetical protein